MAEEKMNPNAVVEYLAERGEPGSRNPEAFPLLQEQEKAARGNLQDFRKAMSPAGRRMREQQAKAGSLSDDERTQVEARIAELRAAVDKTPEFEKQKALMAAAMDTLIKKTDEAYKHNTAYFKPDGTHYNPVNRKIVIDTVAMTARTDGPPDRYALEDGHTFGYYEHMYRNELENAPEIAQGKQAMRAALDDLNHAIDTAFPNKSKEERLMIAGIVYEDGVKASKLAQQKDVESAKEEERRYGKKEPAQAAKAPSESGKVPQVRYPDPVTEYLALRPGIGNPEAMAQFVAQDDAAREAQRAAERARVAKIGVARAFKEDMSPEGIRQRNEELQARQLTDQQKSEVDKKIDTLKKAIDGRPELKERLNKNRREIAAAIDTLIEKVEDTFQDHDYYQGSASHRKAVIDSVVASSMIPGVRFTDGGAFGSMYGDKYSEGFQDRRIGEGKEAMRAAMTDLNKAIDKAFPEKSNEEKMMIAGIIYEEGVSASKRAQQKDLEVQPGMDERSQKYKEAQKKKREEEDKKWKETEQRKSQEAAGEKARKAKEAEQVEARSTGLRNMRNLLESPWPSHVKDFDVELVVKKDKEGKVMLLAEPRYLKGSVPGIAAVDVTALAEQVERQNGRTRDDLHAMLKESPHTAPLQQFKDMLQVMWQQAAYDVRPTSAGNFSDPDLRIAASKLKDKVRLAEKAMDAIQPVNDMVLTTGIKIGIQKATSHPMQTTPEGKTDPGQSRGGRNQ